MAEFSSAKMWPYVTTQEQGVTTITSEPLKEWEAVRSKPANELAEFAQAQAALYFDWRTYAEALHLELYASRRLSSW